MKNYWIKCSPGVGKTSWVTAMARFYKAKLYIKSFNKWWDGFDPGAGYKIILINDFNNKLGDELISLFKNWSEWNRFPGAVKGGYIKNIDPKDWCLIVTSNFSIADCFSSPEDQNAIHRRFNEIDVDYEIRLSPDWTLDSLIAPPYLMVKSGVNPETMGFKYDDPVWHYEPENQSTKQHYIKPPKFLREDVIPEGVKIYKGVGANSDYLIINKEVYLILKKPQLKEGEKLTDWLKAAREKWTKKEKNLNDSIKNYFEGEPDPYEVEMLRNSKEAKQNAKQAREDARKESEEEDSIIEE